MISWNDPSLVLVILIIKTTKTNQKKSHYFFFFFFPSLTSSFASTISIPKFAKHFSNEWNFSNNKLGTIDFPFVQEPILSMKYSDIFFFSSPSPNDSSWNVTNSQRCCPFSRLPFFGRSRFFAPLPCIRPINTRNFRSGWGQMDETSFSPEN